MTGDTKELDETIVTQIDRLYDLIDAAARDAGTPERFGVLSSLRLMVEQSRRASQLLLRDDVVGTPA
jgi:hypothetical protein